MLLFKYSLEALIPDSPADVGIQLARNEFIVSKVLYNRTVRISSADDFEFRENASTLRPMSAEIVST